MIINLRITITDFYKDSGHIGYGLRPSERKNGYATEILKQVLNVARNFQKNIIINQAII